MDSKLEQSKLIALALYEIKGVLASKLGSENETDISTRVAAHLAYALHNEALAMIDGKGFNIEEALKKVKGIDKILNEDYSTGFIKKFNDNST